MPSSVTQPIHDGTDTSLEGFLQRTARIMGAFSHLRDAPLDMPLPETFEPDQHHLKARDAAKNELHKLLNTPYDTVVVEHTQHEKERNARQVAALQHFYDVNTRLGGLRRLLTEIDADRFPEGLLRVALEMLNQDISYEGTEEELRKSFEPEEHAAVWHAKRIAAKAREIAYHTEEWVKETQRTDERNSWLTKLHALFDGI